MDLTELLLPGEYEGEPIPVGTEIDRIVNNRNKITPGCLFVCHKGTKFDSHALLPSLRDLGCAAAIVSSDSDRINAGIPVLRVENTRLAETCAASRFFRSPGDRLTLIGVTGTNGKTSVSTVLWRILSDAGVSCGLIGTVGYRGATGNEKAYDSFHTGDAATMTTPPPLTLYPLLWEMANAGITHVVMEVSSQALDSFRVEPLRFACAIFTNLTPEHLDHHKTMGAYLAAKKRLFEKTGSAVVNGDSPWTDLLLDGLDCQRTVCGTLPGSELRATDADCRGNEGVFYRLHTPDGSFPVFVPIPGFFTVQNTLLALGAAKTLGYDLERAIGSLSRMPSVPGRMERVGTGEFPFSVLIDYAHTEAALRSLLRSVRAFCNNGERIVLLFGCGGDRDPAKRCAMGKAAEELADYSIVTSDNSRSEDPIAIIKAILSGMKDKTKRRVIVDRARAIRYAILSAKKGDVVLLVGKGHEKYEVGADGPREFDEKKIVEDALEERRNGHTMSGDGNADQDGKTD